MTVSDEDNASLFPIGFEYRPELARAATSRELKTAPRHRWFYFPHSYSHRLVGEVLDYWDFPAKGILVDNFAGSGTTLLAARERGLSTVGFDLSPLAVTVTNAKINSYESVRLCQGLERILNTRKEGVFEIPERLSRAFSKMELRELFKLLGPIRKMGSATRNFFLVALLWTARNFCRAVPDGGWFRWKEWPDRSHEIAQAFEYQVTCMIADVEALNWSENIPSARARLADARKLPLPADSVDGLITSPPYANRHDYSRVFHIDLLLLGLSESEVKELRYQSIRSHVEAQRPTGCKRRLQKYREPDSVKSLLEKLPRDGDSRIKRLLKGYFEDIYLSLFEVGRLLRPGGRAAYVVGNVRHAGLMVPVDEIIAELASQANLLFDVAWVMRFRGNSAQQMGRYGRDKARESVVIFSKVPKR